MTIGWRGPAHAEQLAVVLDRVADENQRLYTEQTQHRAALQQALLPETLPSSAAAGERPLRAGRAGRRSGDWYDWRRRRGCVFLVIGDVSGHGLRADHDGSVRYARWVCAQDTARAPCSRTSHGFVSEQEHDYSQRCSAR